MMLIALLPLASQTIWPTKERTNVLLLLILQNFYGSFPKHMYNFLLKKKRLDSKIILVFFSESHRYSIVIFFQLNKIELIWNVCKHHLGLRRVDLFPAIESRIRVWKWTTSMCFCENLIRFHMRVRHSFYRLFPVGYSIHVKW